MDVTFNKPRAVLLPVIEVPEGEIPEDEIESEEEPRKEIRSAQRRVAGLLKRFIRRYLRGIQSKDFLDLVGAEVIVNNYIIFSHVLWRLMKRDWVELDFVLDTVSNMWSFFWGGESTTGYFAGLSNGDRPRALKSLREKKTAALLLAILYYADFECSIESWIDLRFMLRDCWRHFLDKKPLSLDSKVLVDAWVYLHEALPYSVLYRGSLHRPCKHYPR